MTVKEIEKFAQVNVSNLVVKALSDTKLQESILEMNTKVQLLGLGQNSEGVKLSDIGGGYSSYTLKLHPEKKRDKVTLFDTGDYHDTFKLITKSNGDFEIKSNPIKDQDNLFQRWGKEVEGLNNENYIKALELIEREVLQLITNNVLQLV